MNLLYSLPHDLINYIYSFNVDHRIKFKNCMEEIDNAKHFVISTSVHYYIRIADYAVMWKKKSCFKNNHTIRLYLRHGVYACCTDCGQTQCFNYRGCFPSYFHLSEYRRAGYKTLKPPFDWGIRKN